MKRIKIILNAKAGNQHGFKILPKLSARLSSEGNTVITYVTQKKGDAYQEAYQTTNQDCNLILVSGGDGTVHEVANGVVKSGSQIPLAIAPWGTSNDFANYLGLPHDMEGICNMIRGDKQISIDLGCLNDCYFINVAACGDLANIAHQTEHSKKALFGRVAYLFEGFKVILRTRDSFLRLSVESEEYAGDVECVLLLVANSKIIGGFHYAAPQASIKDGYLDVLIIKKTQRLMDIGHLYIDLLSGKHVQNDDVCYFQTKYIKVSGKGEIPVDADGEFAGYLPQTIQLAKGKLKIFVP